MGERILFELGSIVPSLAQGDGMRRILADPFLMIALIVAIVYFLMIRPQRRLQQRETQEMLDNLKKNDQVRTTGGIFGKVVQSTKDVVVLKIDDSKGVCLRVAPSAIVGVVTEKSEKNKKNG